MSNGIAHGELILFDCPRVRKSEYWQFIKLVAPHGSPPVDQTHWLSQDSTDAYCLKCSKMFRFTKGSSNSVRRHMERYHRKELLKRNAQSVEGKKGTLSANNKRASKSASTAATHKTKRRSMDDGELLTDEATATTLDVTEGGTTGAQQHKRHRTEEPPARDMRHGAEALIRWLVLSMRPLTIVDDPGFDVFVEALSIDQPFVVPARDALYHRLELMSESARFEVKQKVKRNVGHFALSAEIWKARVSESDATTVDSHVAIKCWNLSEEFATQSYVLEVFPVDCLTSDKLLELLKDFGLHKSSLSLLFLAESGKLEQETTVSGLRSIVDVATTLSGLVEGMLQQQPQPSSTESMEQSQQRQVALETMHQCLADVANVITWVRTDFVAQARYEQLFPPQSSELTRLPALNPAEWSLAVAHDVVSRAVALRGSLDGLIDRWGATGDSSMQVTLNKAKLESWMLLEGLLVLWRPLYEVVQVATNEKVPSLPFILPILAMAKQHFERGNLFEDLKQRYATTSQTVVISALECLRCELLRGLSDHYEVLCSSLSWISALDPRYGRLRHLSDQERDVSKEHLLHHATELFTSQLPSIPPPPLTEPLGALVAPDFEGDIMYTGDARAPGPTMPGLMHQLLYDEEEDSPPATDTVLSRETEIAQTRLYIANEISLYFNEHQLRRTRILCPLQWWSANRERYPFLAPLARIWLSTRACAWGSTPLAPPSHRVLSKELCDSLGSKDQREQWLKLAGDMIVLQAHLTSVPSGGVTL